MDDPALLGPQRGERGAGPPVLLVELEEVVGGLRRARVGRCMRPSGQRRAQPATVVDTEAAGDRRHPRPERPARCVAVPRRPGPQERLLGELLAVARSREPATEGHERAVVRRVELGEHFGATVARVSGDPLVHHPLVSGSATPRGSGVVVSVRDARTAFLPSRPQKSREDPPLRTKGDTARRVRRTTGVDHGEWHHTLACSWKATVRSNPLALPLSPGAAWWHDPQPCPGRPGDYSASCRG